MRDLRLVRYLLASLGALAVDMGAFLLLLPTGLAPPLAAAAGYSAGIVMHWILSSRAVFTDGVAAKGGGRGKQKVLFVASALVGLGLTTVIVALGDRAGFDPRVAKLAAIGVSFFVTYMLRKMVVFAPAAQP